MPDNLIPQIIQQAKSKRISFENLTPLEQQTVDDEAKRIQQKYNSEFLSEDVITCINRSKGNICCYETLINERVKMFCKYGGRAGWLVFKSLMNDIDDE